MRAHGFVAVVLITGACNGPIFSPIQQQVEAGAESEVWGWVMDNDPAKNVARLHSDVSTHARGNAERLRKIDFAISTKLWISVPKSLRLRRWRTSRIREHNLRRLVGG